MWKGQDFFWPALLGALAFHLFLLWAVDFRPLLPKERLHWLQVELVTEATEKTPEKTPFRAQVSSEGGGRHKSKPLARPQKSDLPPHYGHAQIQQKAAKPSVLTHQALKRIETSPNPSGRSDLRGRAEQNPSGRSDLRGEVEEKPQPRTENQPLDLRRLQQQVQQIGDLLAARQVEESRGVKPIRAIRAKRHIAAAYELAWQRKVEAVGTRHYPKEARHRRAAVLVSVWVREDGRVEKIKILRSSGLEAIDQAVVRIVRLAEPFPPFPEELRREAGVLEITRLWRFESGTLHGE